MPRTIRHQKYAFINNLETAAKFGTLVPFIHCYFNNTYVYQSHQQIQYREYFKWYEKVKMTKKIRVIPFSHIRSHNIIVITF